MLAADVAAAAGDAAAAAVAAVAALTTGAGTVFDSDAAWAVVEMGCGGPGGDGVVVTAWLGAAGGVGLLPLGSTTQNTAERILKMYEALPALDVLSWLLL